MKKQLKVFLGSISMIACVVPFVSTMTSCSNNGVVFANYESYLSDDVISKYRHNIQFLNYSTSEEIDQKFSNNYDAAVPSTNGMLELMKKDELGLVHWDLFKLNNYMNLKWGTDDARFTEWGDRVKTGIQAEGLLGDGDHEGDLSSSAQAFSDLDSWAWDKGYFPQWYMNESCEPSFFADGSGVLHREKHNVKYEASLLDFCVPYFLQSILFAYKGSYLGTKDDDYKEKDGWNKFVGWTSKNSPDHQDRFYGGGDNKGKVYMVDDTRSVYDMSKLYDDEKNGVTDVNINPANAPDYDPTSQSINGYRDTYGSFAKNYSKGSHQFVLNSDSGELTSAFGKGSGANGLLSYNVDVMGAALGNAEMQNEKYEVKGWTSGYDSWMAGGYGHTPDPTNDPDGYKYNYPDFGNFMNVLNPANNIMCYDMIVFNKKVPENSKKQSVLYSLVNDFAVSGIGWFSPEDTNGNNKPIYQYKNDNYDFYYDIMANMDWNMGASPWSAVSSYMLGENLNDQLPYGDDTSVSPYCDEYASCVPNEIADMDTPQLDPDTNSYFESFTYDLIEEYNPSFYVEHGDNTPCSNWVSFLEYCYMITSAPNTDFIKLTELPLTNLSKSNMHWGWQDVKEYL